jgi:hypothetical protein
MLGDGNSHSDYVNDPGTHRARDSIAELRDIIRDIRAWHEFYAHTQAKPMWAVTTPTLSEMILILAEQIPITRIWAFEIGRATASPKVMLKFTRTISPHMKF